MMARKSARAARAAIRAPPRVSATAVRFPWNVPKAPPNAANAAVGTTKDAWTGRTAVSGSASKASPSAVNAADAAKATGIAAVAEKAAAAKAVSVIGTAADAAIGTTAV